MADSNTIGKLVVQMLLDTQQYTEEAAGVEAETKALGADLEQLASSLQSQLAEALGQAAAATEALADAQQSGGIAAEQVAASFEQSTEKQAVAAQKLAAKAEAAANKKAAAEQSAAERATDAQAAEQQRLSDIIYRLEQRTSTEVERLERERARVLASIAEENADERTRIEELFGKQIIAAKQKEADKMAAIAQQQAEKVAAEEAQAQASITANIQQLGEQIGGRMASLADAIGSAFTTGFAIAGTAIAGIAVAATAMGATFQQKMQQVGVVAGATGEQMAELSARARELGATTSFSASEAADAMQNLASAGLSVEDVMQTAGDALVLAGAGGTSLDKASSALTATLSQFSLQADQAGRVADVFAKATAGSQFQVEDLAEAMKYGGVTGAGFGLTLEQTVASLSLFRDAGLDGASAGTVFRSAMVGATTASKANIDALAKYGLTMEDINPATHDFAEILQNVGKAGVSTADMLKVFGTEAGAVMATLAQQAMNGSTQYQDMLASLETSTGAATEMYQQMNATVVGSIAELSSAAEEFLLTLFDTYQGPLAALLESVTALVNRTVAAVQGSSGEISASFASALGALSAFIDENAAYIADTIAGFVRDVASFADGLKALLPYFQQLLPLLDDIALAMGLIWTTIKVAQFVSALESAIAVVGSLGFSIEALMATLTAATGGVYALVAAVGVLVVGLGVLIKRYLDAKDAAEDLKAAQDRLAEGQIRADASRAAQLEALLAVQREEAKVQLEQEAAAGSLTQARRAELETLSTMTGALAQQAEAAGKLVLVNGQLRSVGSIAEEMDPATVQAFTAQVAGLEKKAADSGRAVAALQQVLELLKTSGENVESIQIPGFGEVDTSGGEADIQARIESLKAMGQQYAETAGKLSSDYSRATSAMLEDQARQQKAASLNAVSAVETEGAGKADAEKKYVDKVKELHESLQRENQAIDATASERLDAEMQARSAKIATAYADQIQAAGTNAEEVKRLETQRFADELTLLSIWAAKRQAIVDEAAKKEADERAAQEDKAQQMITAFQRAGMTEAQRLEAEKADALLAIAGASAESRAQVEQLYDAKIKEAQEEARDEAESIWERIAAGWKKVAAGAGAAADAVRVVASAFRSLGDAAAGFMDFWVSALEKLTGFSFSLSEAMTSISDALSEQDTDTGAIGDGAPAPGGQKAAAAGAAKDYVSSLVDEAQNFIKGLVAAIPFLIDALVSEIPRLITTLVDQLPLLIEEVATAIPQLATLFAEQVPRILEAFLQGLPLLVDGLVQALPILVQSFVDMIPGVIDAVVAQLPRLIEAIVGAAILLVDALLQQLPRLLSALLGMIPTIVQQILAALPGLITAFIAGLAQVLTALLNMLPELVANIVAALPSIILSLINGIVAAIPQLAMAVVRAVPRIITSIINGIPRIFEAVLQALPFIITTLVGLVPDLIIGVAEALPLLIPAIVALIPTLIEVIIESLPQIVIALVDSLLIELPSRIPEIAVTIGKAIVKALKESWKALVNVIGDILKAAWEAVKDVFGGDGDRGSGYTGVTYVPATMRMTLHPGEMVVPANRNPARAKDRADPALAGASGGPAGGGGGGQPIQLDVMVDGRVVESVLMNAQKRGTASGLTRFVRTTAGVQAGIDRGRFNRWTK